MTALQKTLITTTLVTAVGAGIYEAHRASTLTSQLQTLQQQQTPLAEEIQRLRHDRDAATDQLAALRDSTNRPSRGASELLRLRSEVGLLREKNQQLAKLQPPQQPPSALAQALSDSNTIVVPSVVTTPMTPPRPINKSFETGQLRDVGNDSLESAAQTALWAILNRDEVGYGHIRFVDTNAPPVSAEDQARQLQQVARNMEGVQQLTLNAWMPDPLRADSAMVFFRAAWPSDSQAVDKPAGGTLVFRNVGAGWNLDSVISQGR